MFVVGSSTSLKIFDTVLKRQIMVHGSGNPSSVERLFNITKNKKYTTFCSAVCARTKLLTVVSVIVSQIIV